ncbi:TnsD family Tn7-like transposition protein [Sphingomonas sp. LB3N6]|uniref:TnsD family Tn7-like transposition protein n=1 Tax=Sphingomonas fucosidasi TaxID=3096164 RepID=UPI002FC8651A
MGGEPAFFPAPRDGELLYSVLARHSRWSVDGPKATMDALFGNAAVIASIDLPNRLAALARHLPPALSVDNLIERHTLAPYYLAFAPSKIRQAVRVGMKGDGASLHLSAGLAAFRAGRVTRLRFCPECIGDMRDRWGSPHWRRDHQLPGVLVCPKHGTLLRQSTVDLHTANRHAFTAATDATCPASAETVTRPVGSADGQTLLRLARASAALLDRQDDGPADFAELTEFYRDELRSRGLMRSRLKVDQVALHAAFMARFGSVADRLPGLLSTERLRGDWLASLARKHRKASHPIEHLLLRDLLGSRDERKQPFGSGPWECRNPLADHFERDVVTDLRIYRNRAAKVAVFSCGCGYRYTRSPRNDGAVGPCRFKEYGPLLGPALVTLIKTGTSLRGVAASLRVDPKTVATLAVELGLDAPWSIRPSARNATPTNADERPTLNLVTTRTRSGSAKPRRDWRRSDLEMSARVAGAAMRIKASAPPARVTCAALERELLGRRGWIAKRADKLPRTTNSLAEVAESLRDFQFRRIDYWIATAAADGRSVRPWTIMRMAGLRSNMLGVIHDRLEAHRQRIETVHHSLG